MSYRFAPVSTISSPTQTRTTHGNDTEVFSFLIRTYVTDFDQPAREKRKRLPHPTLIDNAPGWNEDLATASEAFIKVRRPPSSVPHPTHAYQADRETTTFDEMQQKTVDYVQSHHHDPDVEQTHATYARDEVGGPLGNAGVGEFEGVVGKDDLGPDDAQVESNGRVVTRRVIHERTTVRKGGSGPGQANVSRDCARRHESWLTRDIGLKFELSDFSYKSCHIFSVLFIETQKSI